MQVGNDVEIRNQGSQLGTGAQVKLGTGIDVERLVQVIGLHAQLIAQRGFLIQGEAVIDPNRITAIEQAVFAKAGAAQILGVGHALQLRGNVCLGEGIERRLDLQIEAVERVHVFDTEQIAEYGTHVVDRLALDEGGDSIAPDPSRRGQPRMQGRIAQALWNAACSGEQAQVAVSQLLQPLRRLEQQPRRTALGDNQRENFAEHLGAQLGIGVLVVQYAIRRCKIPAIPRPQAIPQAMHFAVTGQPRQRYRVEVIAHDPLPRNQRLFSIEIGTQRGGDHLLQFVTRSVRPSSL